jgi:hypothetical protein
LHLVSDDNTDPIQECGEGGIVLPCTGFSKQRVLIGGLVSEDEQIHDDGCRVYKNYLKMEEGFKLIPVRVRRSHRKVRVTTMGRVSVSNEVTELGTKVLVFVLVVESSVEKQVTMAAGMTQGTGGESLGMIDLGGLAVPYICRKTRGSDRHGNPGWWSGLASHDDKHSACRICDTPCTAERCTAAAY